MCILHVQKDVMYYTYKKIFTLHMKTDIIYYPYNKDVYITHTNRY